MTILYFTLCSNNYLPFALSLGKSLKEIEPAAEFVIGLVDQLDPQIDYSTWKEFEFLPCFDLGYPEFYSMLARYNIIEFNTAVKPFYFEYLFAKYPEVDRIYYLDPDLYFYQSPKVMDKEWDEAEILLTPNLIYTTAKPSTGELASLRHGMYNLGFIGLKRREESFRLIQWWKERLKEHCRIDKCYGIFVDQKWMDLAPLFFDKIKSVKHPGWNMAWWNFSERKLLKIPKGYAVNQADIPLVFFHFSGFNPEKSHLTERLLTEEFKEAENTALAELYESYRNQLLTNNYEMLSKIKPGLRFKEAPNFIWNRFGRMLKSKMTNAIYRIFGV
ncbi:hypothetical protein [Mongoliitalea lutea]|uniref:Glycosyl transferase family 8 n=1 Tax=Mongoliitalea lutea TaxID=849756 RepID=A0A8J3CTD6_9BACT|nr:hypothetical protein [Mongoliitalea lutea]GHB23807.1 hypothetical protein GCM10008106_00510 [Mongoliitalea lutea]